MPAALQREPGSGAPGPLSLTTRSAWRLRSSLLGAPRTGAFLEVFPLHLRGAPQENADAETGGWGFASLQPGPSDQALRARGARGALGRGEDTGGGCGGWMGPTLRGPRPSCAAAQTLPARTLSRSGFGNFTPGNSGSGWGHCTLNGCGRDPKGQAEIGGAATPSSPQSFRGPFSLSQGVGDCFIFIILRGQRDETKTPWFSPKPLTAAVRKGRAGRASDWGWRCPRWLETAAPGS